MNDQGSFGTFGHLRVEDTVDLWPWMMVDDFGGKFLVNLGPRFLEPGVLVLAVVLKSEDGLWNVHFCSEDVELALVEEDPQVRSIQDFKSSFQLTST